MKASKRVRLSLLACAIGVLVVSGVCKYCRNELEVKGCIRPGDFWMRHNEICCSHKGVDPFRVWMREVRSDIYCGHDNPSLPTAVTNESKAGKLIVHAYPPWHTTFFWPIGWVSYARAVSFLFLLMGAAIPIALKFLGNEQPEDRGGRWVFWCVLLSFLTVPSVFAYIYGNYGILLAGASMFLVFCMARGHDLLGGITLAFLMIKPQVGTLFVLPLLFQRRFRMIAVGAGLCLVATLWPAYVYGESPIKLILDVPKIGAPWTGPRYWPPLKACYWPTVVANCETIVCFGLCAVWCFCMRRARPLWLTFVPVAVFMPLWTYSNVYDHVVAWPVALLFAAMLSRDEIAKWHYYEYICYCGLLIAWNVTELIRSVVDHQLMWMLCCLLSYAIRISAIGVMMHLTLSLARSYQRLTGSRSGHYCSDNEMH